MLKRWMICFLVIALLIPCVGAGAVETSVYYLCKMEDYSLRDKITTATNTDIPIEITLFFWNTEEIEWDDYQTTEEYYQATHEYALSLMESYGFSSQEVKAVNEQPFYFMKY